MAKKTLLGGLAALILAVPMVAHFEGERLTAYNDSNGIPTICYGETDPEAFVTGNFTDEQCKALLGVTMSRVASEMQACIHVDTTPSQAAAIISWAYNVGTGAACRSTLVKLLNSGAAPEVWCKQLSRWTISADGSTPKGLAIRRQSELKMCTTGKWQ
jgi:lysozyme